MQTEFEALAVVAFKIYNVWYLTLWNLVNNYSPTGGTCSFRPQDELLSRERQNLRLQATVGHRQNSGSNVDMCSDQGFFI
jgi:hypothetical protein